MLLVKFSIKSSIWEPIQVRTIKKKDTEMNQRAGKVKKLTNVKGEEISLSERYLSIKEVIAKCGVSRSTILRLEANKKFPPSHNITENRKVWFESDVQIWRTLGAQAFYENYGVQLEQAA